MVIRLTDEQKEQIKNKFQEYLSTNKTTKNIANELGVEKSTVAKFYSKLFGEQYKRMAKSKCYQHNTILSDNQVLKLFERYKNGTPVKELEKISGVGYGSLCPRMLRLIGEEYQKVSLKRKYEKAGNFYRKVIDFDVRIAFEKYKSTSVSTTALADELGLAESTLIFRFKKLFGND
ncbi:MAG: hypothetical protein AABX00_01900 [Nanoarchaeota archaeon]